MKKILFFLLLLLSVFWPGRVLARDYVYEWYIKDINTIIDINDDGSLDIEERIVADCGDLSDKHGIFRVVPTRKYLTDLDVIDYDIELIGITDFEDNPYNFAETVDTWNDTLTWKIGDPDITVQGENEYLIKYRVSNAIQGNSIDFDEFYWNVHGQFWDMQADHVEATVNFPEGFDYSKQETNLYSGSFGANDAMATYEWVDKNTIQVESSQMFDKEQGITLSVTMPKGMTQVATVTKIDKTWANILAMAYLVLQLSGLLLAPIVLLFAFYIWYKYGKDPVLNKTIIAQYEPPMNLNPMQIGMLVNNGKLDTRYITASIVNLAVKKLIKIEEIPKKGWFGSKDFKMDLLVDKSAKEYTSLQLSEQKLVDYVFGSTKTKKLSALKDRFYVHIDSLKNQVRKELVEEKKLFDPQGFSWAGWLTCGLIFCFIAGFILFALAPFLSISLIVSAVVLWIFSYFMSKLTKAGAEAQWQAKGFKLFMQTADRYRQQFYEKEFIFEKFLPYAIVFDIVKQWIKNMETIYGVEKMRSYSPYWYTSSAMASGFDVNSFSSTLNSMSSNMSSTMSSSPSSSGSGGGGSSGGGGGGGGGGGW